MSSHTPVAGFIDLMMDAVFAVEADATVVFASAACERILGYTPQEMVGANMFDLMLPEDRERTRKSLVAIMEGRPQFNYENRYLRKDGQVVHLMWSTRWSEADQLRIGVARDITERKRAESLQTALYAISEAAFAAEDLLGLCQGIHRIVGTLLPADNFSVMLYDAEKKVLSFPYHVDAYQSTPESCEVAPGSLCAQILHSGEPLLLMPAADVAEYAMLPSTGSVQPLCWLGIPLKSHNGTFGLLVVKSYPGGIFYSENHLELLQFVSTQIATAIERLQMRVRLQRMAQFDQLTSLPNRALLADRLEVALSLARREWQQLALLFLDLDRFKQVNDSLGHDVGDALLQGVAERLKSCVRESDTVARIGGDEFVVLLSGATADHGAQVAEKIRTAFGQPFEVEGHHVNILPSIGVASYPEHGTTRQQLLMHADKAMYSAKRSAGSDASRHSVVIDCPTPGGQ